ncbi:MAG TPA: bifunctional 4-hydroxy-2-oxoglutarate aldolase/2-dehydro-3-deoxy-phosphogluconate aldolase [Verrucomicrobiae bacterium]|nr:bifunctional 4-hydroxy-2-oxoglutarate aldolase/2-dehydro-3-deoxy-phosphogluconate aldolase [Verrucomicrobiae bacterium]
MTTRAEIVSRLIDIGIIAVVRTERTEQVMPIAEALVAGGVTAVEVTLTVPDAETAIAAAREKFRDSAVIGAGSVLNIAQCHSVLKAGAQFVVSPVGNVRLIEAAHKLDRPVMLGAFTPSEAQLVHEWGADFVKLFPADQLGPSFIKAIRAPMPHLRIVPTGGVDLATAKDFLKAGCVALGVGTSLLKPDLIVAENWPELSRLAGQYVEIVRRFRG